MNNSLRIAFPIFWVFLLMSFGTPSETFAQNKKLFKPLGRQNQAKKVPVEQLKVTKTAKQILRKAQQQQQQPTSNASLNLYQLQTKDLQEYLQGSQTAHRLGASNYSVFRGANGLPIFMDWRGPTQIHDQSEGKVETSIYRFLENQKNLLKVENPKESFRIKSQETDPLGMTHVRMEQYFQGYPIWGADIALHLKNGLVKTFNGRYQATPDQKLFKPEVSIEQAMQIVEADLSKHTKIIKWPNHL